MNSALPFSVQERDVDLLILEQFHLSPTILQWFAERVGASGGRFESARHSVFDANGETDVLLFLLGHEGRIAVMIEDKIGAAMQPRQCERYHERGSSLCREGKAVRYTTVLCAPRSYLAQVPDDQKWQTRIPLEDVADRLGQDTTPAARWRRSILDAAASKVTRAIQAEDKSNHAFDAPLRALRQAYRLLILRDYPDLRATEQLGRDREYYLSATGLPHGIRFKHSFFRGEVSLILERGWAKIDKNWLATNAPANSWIVTHGGELHVRKSTDVMDPALAIDEQEGTASKALDLIRQLVAFAQLIVQERRLPPN